MAKIKLSINRAKQALAMAMALYACSSFATGYHTQNGGTTGGAGGTTVSASTGTEIHAALCNRASSDTPIIIEVQGTINHGNTSKVSGDSCNTADDVIELKEISNVTLIGVGNGAVFDQLGIHIRNSSNIIIRNITVKNVKKSGSPTSNGGDAIGMESNVSNIWVDHVTLEASGGEDDGYDALFDLKNNSKYVTLSYSILRNSGRGGLVGSSDSDDDNGPVTYHHNIYQNIDSRTPLLRHATAHSYNNYYVNINSSGMNPRIGGEIRVENNYFEDSKDVLGTFYTNDYGYWQVIGNIFDNITWTSDGDDNHPAGPNPTSTTSISIPYNYNLDDASCIQGILAVTAGAGTGLATSDGSCTVVTDPGNGGGDGGSGGDSGSGGDGGSGDGGSGDGGSSGGTGENLALSADADGSSKASGTSYGNVKDGDTSSYWSPSGSTGRISIKNLNTTINAVRIVETSSSGTITSWTLESHDTGATLASGSSVPDVIEFSDVSLSKVSFYINGASGTPQISEFEVYNGYTSGNTGGSSGDGSSVNNGTMSGTYRITPVHSDKAVDVTNCNTANTTNVQQFSWLNTDCQKFVITPVDGIWHRISPLIAPTKGLDIASNSTAAGANIQIYDYWGGSNQQFRFQSAGTGKWRIIPRHSELCMDVSGNSAADGRSIIQWTCNAGAENQMFELERQ